jgi:hypothetical protein
MSAIPRQKAFSERYRRTERITPHRMSSQTVVAGNGRPEQTSVSAPSQSAAVNASGSSRDRA